MKLTGQARWTATGNLIGVLCDCGHEFETCTDRWGVSCPSCHKPDKMGRLRDQEIADWKRGLRG